MLAVKTHTHHAWPLCVLYRSLPCVYWRTCIKQHTILTIYFETIQLHLYTETLFCNYLLHHILLTDVSSGIFFYCTSSNMFYSYSDFNAFFYFCYRPDVKTLSFHHCSFTLFHVCEYIHSCYRTLHCHVAVWVSFVSTWMIPFSVSCRKDLVVMDFFPSLCLSGKVFISPVLKIPSAVFLSIAYPSLYTMSQSYCRNSSSSLWSSLCLCCEHH